MKNFNVINVTLLTVGGILIYCGVKGISPKEALQEILSGSKKGTKESRTSFDKDGGASGEGGGGGGAGSW